MKYRSNMNHYESICHLGYNSDHSHLSAPPRQQPAALPGRTLLNTSIEPIRAMDPRFTLLQLGQLLTLSCAYIHSTSLHIIVHVYRVHSVQSNIQDKLDRLEMLVVPLSFSTTRFLKHSRPIAPLSALKHSAPTSKISNLIVVLLFDSVYILWLFSLLPIWGTNSRTLPSLSSWNWTKTEPWLHETPKIYTL